MLKPGSRERYKEGLIIKRGNGWPYFWVLRKVILCGPILAYQKVEADREIPIQVRGGIVLNKNYTVWKPPSNVQYFGKQFCLFVYRPKEETQGVAEVEHCIEEWCKATHPKFVFTFFDDSTCSEWEAAIKGSIGQLKLLSNPGILKNHLQKHCSTTNPYNTEDLNEKEYDDGIEDDMGVHPFANMFVLKKCIKTNAVHRSTSLHTSPSTLSNSNRAMHSEGMYQQDTYWMKPLLIQRPSTFESSNEASTPQLQSVVRTGCDGVYYRKLQDVSSYHEFSQTEPSTPYETQDGVSEPREFVLYSDTTSDEGSTSSHITNSLHSTL